MRRALLFTFVFAVLITACGVSDDAEVSEDSEVAEEIIVGGEVVVTASVPVAEDDDVFPLESNTLP